MAMARVRTQTHRGMAAQNSKSFIARCARHLEDLKGLGHSAAECSGRNCRRPVWSIADPGATAQEIFHHLGGNHNLGKYIRS